MTVISCNIFSQMMSMGMCDWLCYQVTCCCRYSFVKVAYRSCLVKAYSSGCFSWYVMCG